eukprot:gene3756-biopygen5730
MPHGALKSPGSLDVRCLRWSPGSARHGAPGRWSSNGRVCWNGVGIEASETVRSQPPDPTSDRSGDPGSEGEGSLSRSLCYGARGRRVQILKAEPPPLPPPRSPQKRRHPNPPEKALAFGSLCPADGRHGMRKAATRGYQLH